METNNIEQVINKIDELKINEIPPIQQANSYIDTISQVIAGTKHLQLDTLRVNLPYNNMEEYKLIESAIMYYIDMGYQFTCYHHYDYMEILIVNN
jgi:hypothetical protein